MSPPPGGGAKMSQGSGVLASFSPSTISTVELPFNNPLMYKFNSMTQRNESTASLILNGLSNSDITIMSPMQRQFSDQYWDEAIEELKIFSLEQRDGKYMIGSNHLTEFMEEIVMNSNIASLEMIILVIECIKNSCDGQKALFRLWWLDEITMSSPGEFVFIKWLSYAINRIEERVERVEDEGIIGTDELLVEMKIVANIMELICSFSVIKKNKQLHVLKNKYRIDWFFIVQEVSSTHHFKLPLYCVHIFI